MYVYIYIYIHYGNPGFGSVGVFSDLRRQARYKYGRQDMEIMPKMLRATQHPLYRKSGFAIPGSMYLRRLRPLFVTTSRIFAGSTRSGSRLKGAKSPNNKGSSPGNSTRRMLVCELSVCTMAVIERRSRHTSYSAHMHACCSCCQAHVSRHCCMHARAHARVSIRARCCIQSRCARAHMDMCACLHAHICFFRMPHIAVMEAP